MCSKNMCYDVEFEFEDVPMSIECLKANGETAIFTCEVCKRKYQWASPCTPDDCKERLKDFCEGKDDGMELLEND